MSASIVITAFIVVIISLIMVVLNRFIYKKTIGGSKAYYFWMVAAIFTFLGATIAFIASFFIDPNKTELDGAEGFVAVIQLTFYLWGYYYIALGALTLPAQMKITSVNVERLFQFKHYVFFGIFIWSSVVSGLLVIIDQKIPVRMFYVPFFAISWLVGFFAMYPFYTTVKNYARYWIYMQLAFMFGFLANVFEIIAFFMLDSLIVFKPIFFSLMGIFLVLGFYKLGKDVRAF